jgi:hypothetical protein
LGRRRSVKKLIFSLFVIPLVVAFASCNLNPVPGQDNVPRSGDDGDNSRELKRYVTLRLADSGKYVSDSIGIGIGNTVSDAAVPADTANSRSGSRALTYKNAVASHDFFEAVFYYSTNPGNTVIARTAWNIGNTPELRGVYREPAPGIDYGFVSHSAVTDTATQGAAVLFVGAKESNGSITLLALGRLVEVDGTTGTTITNESESVTFEVAAIKAGVNKTGDPDVGSFRTYREYSEGSNNDPVLTDDATDIYNDIYIHYVDKKYFPFFKLELTPNNKKWGAYTFGVDAAAAPNPGLHDFNLYAAGIVLAGEQHYEARNPRYPITSGLYQYSSFLVQDLDMMNGTEYDGMGGLDMENNTTAGNYFKNPVVFKIDTSASQDGSVFALVFEIFVYNLTSAPSSLIKGAPSPFPTPVKWRISPGYGTYWLDLDDGLGGTGGAIFMGTGDVHSYLPGFPFVPSP